MAAHPLDTLHARGFVAAITDEAGVRRLFDGGQVTFYVGFDPTAASLHVGHLVGMMAMSHLQAAGHRPIALAGGATGRIGDPSFRDRERGLLDEATVTAHLDGIRRNLTRVLDLSDPHRGLVVDNAEWLGQLDLLGFLRDVGKHFSVNAMVSRESVRRRLAEPDRGLSFTEFSYQLLQAYDFAHLYATHGCRVQGGGSDQWGNITAGIDLTRRRHGASVFGITWPLMEGSDGKKFSKSAGNAPWLDPEMTSPYAYYQWWFNVDDRDVARFLKLFTFLDLDEIEQVAHDHAADPSARLGQRMLAREATRVIHGDEGVAVAENATAVLFGAEPFTGMDDQILADAFEGAAVIEQDRARLEHGDVGLLALLTESGATSSNGQARRLVAQGAVRINNTRVEDPRRVLTPADLASPTTVVLRVGKKHHVLARFT